MDKNAQPDRPPLSIIIPLAAEETLWQKLLPALAVEAADEIIIAAHDAPPPDWPQWQQRSAAPLHWLHCGDGSRAANMNAAAKRAQNAFLWFIHADSRPAAGAIGKLRRSLAAAPGGVRYFHLRFYDGGWKMRLNELGARWRCRLFSNPFGDQALCLSKALFDKLQGYDETAAYGEDHLLVMRAHRSGAAVVPVAATVATSARRYIQHGWWRTVCLYQRLWWRQWRL